MISAKEATAHLNNLSRSHEITRELLASLAKSENAKTSRTEIIIGRHPKGWVGLFNGHFVPLPFTPAATPQQVAADVAKRFPSARIVVRI